MEYFDKNSVLSQQEDQIAQLEQKLQREREKLSLMTEMFETGKMNEKLLFGSTSCTLKKPFQHIHNIMTKEEGDIARDFFAKASTDQMNAELVLLSSHCFISSSLLYYLSYHIILILAKVLIFEQMNAEWSRREIFH